MKDLNAFLEEGVGEIEADEVPIVKADDVVAPEPIVEDDAAKLKPEPEAPDVPDDVKGLRSALQATRRERSDHKGRADKLEGEAAELRAQLDEFKKVSAAAAIAPMPVAAPVPRPAPPNPFEDPEGWQAHNEQKVAERVFSTLCDVTEDALREKEGDAAVDAALKAFGDLIAKEPALRGELVRQRNPFKWMFQTVKRAEASREIGNDPDAWKAAQRETMRAEILAEQAGKATPAAAVALPTSLSGARNAGTRAAETDAEVEFEDIFKPRKRS